MGNKYLIKQFHHLTISSHIPTMNVYRFALLNGKGLGAGDEERQSLNDEG